MSRVTATMSAALPFTGAAGTAADLGPDIGAVGALQADLGGGGAAEIARLHERGLDRAQILGMDERRGRPPQQRLGRQPDQALRRRAGEADAAVGAVARDQVHRVIGEEAVHRGALGGGLVRRALAVLRGGGDESRLHHRREQRCRIDLPGRNRQARERQPSRRLDRGHRGQRRRRRTGRAQHRGPPARQRRFRRHQHQPDHQRRGHAAGEEREIADQPGEERERGLFEERKPDRR